MQHLTPQFVCMYHPFPKPAPAAEDHVEGVCRLSRLRLNILNNAFSLATFLQNKSCVCLKLPFRHDSQIPVESEYANSDRTP